MVMARRVEKHAVGGGITTALSTMHDVMVVPAGEFGDFLVADGAKAILLLPEVEELAAPFEIVRYFDAEAFFKVDFPGGVVWVGISFDFDVSCERGIGGA